MQLLLIILSVNFIEFFCCNFTSSEKNKQLFRKAYLTLRPIARIIDHYLLGEVSSYSNVLVKSLFKQVHLNVNI